MNQLDSLSGQSIESVGSLHVMKSRPLQDKLVDDRFKSRDIDSSGVAAQQREDIFQEVRDTLTWSDNFL